MKFLREIDIKNALELANVKSNDEKFKAISKKFGTKAIRTILELNGISCIEINTTTRKSIMRSTSLKEETSDFEHISSVISTLSEECASALRRERLCAGALSIFITTNPFKENFFSEFSTIPLPYQTNSTFEIVALSLKLFESLYAPGHLYKRIGVILTELVPEDHAQTHLFITPDERKETISKLIDKINTRFGVNILHLASSIPSTPPPPHIIQINFTSKTLL
jgi:DNA polymerase V